MKNEWVKERVNIQPVPATYGCKELRKEKASRKAGLHQSVMSQTSFSITQSIPQHSCYDQNTVSFLYLN